MMPSLQRIDHIHIYVSERQAAEHWYRAVLGFTRVKELEFWAKDDGPLTLTDATGQIHLALFARPAQTRQATIAFAVDAENFLSWHKHLRNWSALTVTCEDHVISWSLYFHDLDGNPFEITCYDYETLRPHLSEQ